MAMTLSNIRVALPGWQDDGVSDPPMLIELTAKRWKGLTLLSVLMGWLGMAILLWQIWAGLYLPLIDAGIGFNTEPIELLKNALSSFAAFSGIVIFGVAMIIGFYARFMAWWRHG